jgi:hypothetical protein
MHGAGLRALNHARHLVNLPAFVGRHQSQRLLGLVLAQGWHCFSSTDTDTALVAFLRSLQAKQRYCRHRLHGKPIQFRGSPPFHIYLNIPNSLRPPLCFCVCSRPLGFIDYPILAAAACEIVVEAGQHSEVHTQTLHVRSHPESFRGTHAVVSVQARSMQHICSDSCLRFHIVFVEF